MSNVETHEEKQARLAGGLEATYDRMFTTTIFFCIGWFVFVVTWIGPGVATNGVLWFLLGLVGWVIAPLPMLGRMMSGGFKDAFNMPSYEVITTHADGSKTSDGGAESAMASGVAKMILLGIMVIIGLAATAVYSVVLTIKYAVLYARVRAKPSFLRSGFFLIVVNVVVLAGAVLVGGVIQNNISARYRPSKETDVLRAKYAGGGMALYPEVLALMSQANAETEMASTRKGSRRPDKYTIRVEGVAYFEDCTIVYVTAPTEDLRSYTPSVTNSKKYDSSLVVKDLDGGNTYPLLPGGSLGVAHYEDTIVPDAAGNMKNLFYRGAAFVFPPFTSRHFSLTHTAEDKGNNLTKLTISWDFPEVKVNGAARAPAPPFTLAPVTLQAGQTYVIAGNNGVELYADGKQTYMKKGDVFTVTEVNGSNATVSFNGATSRTDADNLQRLARPAKK